ncbi:MAG: hypothetical protein PHU52_05615 [Dehalococcoidales bacterium]|nr:hypothetical protein [Dehalococcoidales bacterium]
MKIKRRRKCRYCGRLYRPNARVRQQRYCSRPECQRASHQASQRRWLNRPANRNHFRDSIHVDRVRKWRKKHPFYWRRRHQNSKSALQDVISTQTVVNKRDNSRLNPIALQDVIFTQPAVVVGLIASLTGSALQDEIVNTAQKMQAVGQAILGMGS